MKLAVNTASLAGKTTAKVIRRALMTKIQRLTGKTARVDLANGFPSIERIKINETNENDEARIPCAAYACAVGGNTFLLWQQYESGYREKIE